MAFLQYLLSLVVGLSDFWTITVPVLVMGLFALVVRLSLRRYN